MFLIDGHNLMYAKNCQSRRELVDLVDEFCESKKQKVIIVFDGVSNIDLSTDYVRVINAGLADPEIISQMDLCEASKLVLISSDKQLQYEARSRRIQVINSENFNLNVRIYKDDDRKNEMFLTDAQVEAQLREFNNFKK